MAEPKTKKTNASVEDFLSGVADQRKRQDCFVLVDLIREVTGSEPSMWGDSIVGCGGYRSPTAPMSMNGLSRVSLPASRA